MVISMEDGLLTQQEVSPSLESLHEVVEFFIICAIIFLSF
jgi:hypothetical protein